MNQELHGRNPLLAEDDDLPTADVRSWAEEKYRHVYLYTKLFSTAMKNKWECRVYIDLYAGPGLAQISGTGRVLKGSPLLALTVPEQFDKYIFCESDPRIMKTLQQRVGRAYPHANVHFVSGDCNDKIDEICSAIPPFSKQHRVLTFCFADPYDISIRFSTVRKLSKCFVDFLFLLALHMDANRNVAHYTNPANQKIDEFLEVPEWRDLWDEEQSRRTSFPNFLAQEYDKQMQSLRYLPMPLYKMKAIRSDAKNLPLYHLALFSRNNVAYQLWDEVLHYGTDQLPLW
jgi:three-Cys-motif partner protein